VKNYRRNSGAGIIAVIMTMDFLINSPLENQLGLFLKYSEISLSLNCFFEAIDRLSTHSL